MYRLFQEQYEHRVRLAVRETSNKYQLTGNPINYDEFIEFIEQRKIHWEDFVSKFRNVFDLKACKEKLKYPVSRIECSVMQWRECVWTSPWPWYPDVVGVKALTFMYRFCKVDGLFEG